MFGESVVTILFRLLNFAALVGLFAFIFKKYFKKEIEESIEHDHLEEINQQTRKREIEQRGSELSEEITKQQKLCEHLAARTNQWKVAFEKEVKQKKQEQHVLRNLAKERAEQQAKTIVYERTVQSVLPKALDKARNKLKESFAASEHGREFVKGIIVHMKKSL